MEGSSAHQAVVVNQSAAEGAPRLPPSGRTPQRSRFASELLDDSFLSFTPSRVVSRVPSIRGSAMASRTASGPPSRGSASALPSVRTSRRIESPERAIDASGTPSRSAIALAAGLLRDAVRTGDESALTPRAAKGAPGSAVSAREAELSGIFSDRVASRRKLRESLSARMDMLEENENPAPAAKPLKPTPRKLVLEPSPVKSQGVLSPLPHLGGSGRAPLLKAQLGTVRAQDQQRRMAWVDTMCREAFSMYDEGRKGWLSSHECKCAFTAVMGRKPSPIEISHLLRKCPGGRSVSATPQEDPSGCRVLWSDFVESVRARVTAVDPVVRANRIFTCYDADGNGHLDMEEATRAFRQMVPDISDALVRAMFASADANGDGRVSREEFVAFVAPRLAHRTAAMGLAPTDALTGGNSGAGSSLFPSAAPSALTSASASIRTTPAASRWHSRPGSASRERALPLRP